MEDVLARIWGLLSDAVERRSPFTAMQLATVGMDGAPKLRTIILRRFDLTNATISFVTDRRAGKVRDIAANPRVSLAGYDPSSNVQLRSEGMAIVVEDDDERNAMWATLRPHTHVLFTTPFAPGTKLSVHDQAQRQVPAHSDVPHEHYCLIRIHLDRVELLDLSAEPHARHGFRRGQQGWAGGRIAP